MTTTPVRLLEQFGKLSQAEREAVYEGLTPLQAEALLFDWRAWARPEQLPDKFLESGKPHWGMIAGRGFGKSRTGSEFVRERVEDPRPGVGEYIALVAETPADARDVMVEGPSGFLNIYPRDESIRPKYEPSKRRLVWPANRNRPPRVQLKEGTYAAMATIYSGAEPDQLRGPQHDTYWADEVAAWKYPRETWNNLMFGFRIGPDPRGIFTTTPKPIELMRDLIRGEASERVYLTGGTTYDNLENLSPNFRDEILSKYEGSRIGRQELLAELLEDVPGALWTRTALDLGRVPRLPDGLDALWRIVVGVDPSVTSGEDSAEAGIIVAGIGPCECKGYEEDHGFVLADLTLRGTPLEWATAAVEGYRDWAADRIVAEVNNGGDLVETVIHQVDSEVSYRDVRAARGKYNRAEPKAALYEQGRVHHVGAFETLEDQLCTWVPGDKKIPSPDRYDALVWTLHDLFFGRKAPRIRGLTREREDAA